VGLVKAALVGHVSNAEVADALTLSVRQVQRLPLPGRGPTRPPGLLHRLRARPRAAACQRCARPGGRLAPDRLPEPDTDERSQPKQSAALWLRSAAQNADETAWPAWSARVFCTVR